MEADIEKRKVKIKNALFFWVKDNYDKAFLVTLIVAFIVRFWIFLKTMNQPLWFDAAGFLATAKRWGLGLNITDIWYYRRGFFWPLFEALFFRIGLGEVTIRFTEVLFSTGIIVVSYFLIKEMFNKKLALLTSLGLTFSWIILFFTARPMTSIPASFFLLLSLLFFWKGYALKQGNKFIYLFALFYAVSILTRMQYLMFAPVFLIYFFVKDRFRFLKNKNLWIACLIFLLILSPQFILYGKHFGNPLKDITRYYLKIGAPETQTIEQPLSKIFGYFIDLPYMLSKPIFILFLIGIFYFFLDSLIGFDKLFKNEEIQKKFFVLLWIIIPFLFLGYMTSMVEQRYIIPALPFLFLIVSSALLNIGNLLAKQLKFNKKFLTALIAVSLLCLLIPNFLWANELIEIKKTSYLEVKQAGLWIKENSDPGDMVVTSSYPQISYYAERSISTFGDRGNPEDRDLMTTEEFYEFMDSEKPRYLILSRLEPYPEWVPSFLQEDGRWIPIRAYPSSQEPVLVIYEYMNITAQ